jgi:hypothetical protein
LDPFTAIQSRVECKRVDEAPADRAPELPAAAEPPGEPGDAEADPDDDPALPGDPLPLPALPPPLPALPPPPPPTAAPPADA